MTSYLSDIPNFILIKHKWAEIQGREVNKKKWVLRHCDLDLWPKVTKFNRVWASAGSNHIAKTASKSVHPFGWNFVHKKFRTHRHTHTHTHRHTDTQTNCNENITPPRFRGGVKNLGLCMTSSRWRSTWRTTIYWTRTSATSTAVCRATCDSGATQNQVWHWTLMMDVCPHTPRKVQRHRPRSQRGCTGEFRKIYLVLQRFTKITVKMHSWFYTQTDTRVFITVKTDYCLVNDWPIST